MVHDGVGHCLDILVVALGKVLELLVGFMPRRDAKGMKNVLDLVADLNWNWLLISLVGAPHLQMLSSRVLTNCLSIFIPWTSITREEQSTKICALGTSPSMAGVSE